MTDRDAVISAFKQSRRNIPFFAALAYLLTFLPHWLGKFGLVITAIGALLYVVFVGQALLTTVLGFVSLASWPFRTEAEKQLMQTRWVALGVLLISFDAIVYAACFYYIGKTSSWWGVFS